MRKENHKKLVKFLTFLCLFLILASVISFFVGCAKEKIVVEYKEVFKAVPQKCDLNISKPVKIDIGTLQRKLDTITDLSYDGLELREKIKAVPCLNITEIERLENE